MIYIGGAILVAQAKYLTPEDFLRDLVTALNASEGVEWQMMHSREEQTYEAALAAWQEEELFYLDGFNIAGYGGRLSFEKENDVDKYHVIHFSFYPYQFWKQEVQRIDRFVKVWADFCHTLRAELAFFNPLTAEIADVQAQRLSEQIKQQQIAETLMERGFWLLYVGKSLRPQQVLERVQLTEDKKITLYPSGALLIQDYHERKLVDNTE